MRSAASGVASETNTDLAQLQGAWTSIAGQRPGHLLIAGNHYAMWFFDGALYMGTFELEEDSDERTMTMRIKEGPPRHKGKLTQCLYHLMGDLLRWCPGKPGQERPAVFPAEETRADLCLLFRRERPWRPHEHH